jgi:GDPmannose 4,6-dehydratase
VSGILYNHESPRRGLQFVTRKITHAAAAIAKGLSAELRLGDLGARRDWGFAGDYVDVMWRMLQQDTPETFVVATGRLHTVQEVAEIAFASVDLDWRDYVVTDGAFLRPDDDAACLLGDATHATERLGWTPEVSFEELIRTMVFADLSRIETGREYDTVLDWPAGRYPLAELDRATKR